MYYTVLCYVFQGHYLGTGFLNKFTILTVIVVLDNLEYKEVMMAGGGVHTVPITIEKCGTAIAWEFNTEPKGIAFGIVYKPTSESSREDEVRTYMYMYMYIHVYVCSECH